MQGEGAGKQDAMTFGEAGGAQVHVARACGGSFDAPGSALCARPGPGVRITPKRETKPSKCTRQEAHLRDLRFYVACMEVLATQKPADGDEATLQLVLEELAAFHRLVVHRVTHDAVITHARASVQAAMARLPALPEDGSQHAGPEAVRAACHADLQLVVPRIWLGSAQTLASPTLLASQGVQYLVRCVATPMEASQDFSTLEEPTERVPQTIEVLELSRLAFETAVETSEGRQKLQELSENACDRLERVAMWLNLLLERGDVLLYCDSGVSTSVSVCAALVMTRFSLPLADALALLCCARRDVQPSKHLLFQLQVLERRALKARDQQ